MAEPAKKGLFAVGRDESKILDSGFLKRFKTDDPTDWSRYADDPDGVMNQRRLTREERRRQFQMTEAVGDAKATGPRNFKPLFEELDGKSRGVKTYADGARLRLLRYWDGLYLALLGWFILWLPAALEEDFGLTHGRGCRGLRFGECDVLYPPLLLMTFATLPPILGGLFLRMVALKFLRGQGAERRHWSLFFVLALKAAAHPIKVPKEFLDVYEACRAYVKDQLDRARQSMKVAPEEEEDWEPEADVWVNDSDAPGPAGAPAPAPARRVSAPRRLSAPRRSSLFAAAIGLRRASRRASQRVADADSESVKTKDSAASEEDEASVEHKLKQELAHQALHHLHHAGEARVVAWRCVACGRSNREPLVVKHDEKVQIVVHRIGRKHGNDDRICAAFKSERYRPRCATCETGIDYKIRPSNADKFHEPSGDALHAYSLIAAARAAQDKKKEDARFAKLEEARVEKLRADFHQHGHDLHEEDHHRHVSMTKVRAVGRIAMGAKFSPTKAKAEQKFDVLTGEALPPPEEAADLERRQRGAMIVTPAGVPDGPERPRTAGSDRPGTAGSDRPRTAGSQAAGGARPRRAPTTSRERSTQYPSEDT